jgi:hypothetical protein
LILNTPRGIELRGASSNSCTELRVTRFAEFSTQSESHLFELYRSFWKPCRNAARRYRGRADYVELAGSHHLMIGGPFMPAVLAEFDRWVDMKGINSQSVDA